MEVTFIAESISVESWPRDRVRVTAKVEPEELLESLDVDDRIKGLDEHEVIVAMGIGTTLDTLSEAELANWIKDSADLTDLLNAIGETEIRQWLADCGSDGDSPV